MKYLLTLLMTLYTYYTFSQSWMGIGIGGNLNQLRFKNAAGILDNNLKGLPGVSATVSLHTIISKSKGYKKEPASSLICLEGGYKSGRIKNKNSSLLTSWSLQYLTSSITLRRNSNSNYRVCLFYGGGLSVDYLISGTQNRGFEQFDLTQDLNRVNISGTIETGLKYTISDISHATFGVSYLRALSNLEKDTNQQAHLHSWKLSATIFFDLEKK